MSSIKHNQEKMADLIQQGRLIPTIRKDFILPNGEEAYVAIPQPREQAVAFLKRVLYRLRNFRKLFS